jgi:hypothetical protein
MEDTLLFLAEPEFPAMVLLQRDKYPRNAAENTHLDFKNAISSHLKLKFVQIFSI